MIRTIRRVGVILLLIAAGALSSKAQIGNIHGSVYVGFGTATDSSVGPINTLNGGIVYNTPSMGGLFDTIGGDVIFFHNLGAGFEYSFRNSRGPYGGLEYRPAFYDVNAVYQPLGGSRRFVPEIQGGIGRASLRLYYTPQFCLTYALGCRSNTSLATGPNYKEIHFGGGVRYYVYKDFYVRPQVDVRWVPDMIYFKNTLVPEFSVAVGYTFRRPK